jgi:hypothetical protein
MQLSDPIDEKGPKVLPEITWVYIVLEVVQNPQAPTGIQYNIKGIYDSQEEANDKILELQDVFASLVKFHLKDNLLFHRTDENGGTWWDMEFVDSRTTRMQVEKWF